MHRRSHCRRKVALDLIRTANCFKFACYTAPHPTELFLRETAVAAVAAAAAAAAATGAAAAVAGTVTDPALPSPLKIAASCPKKQLLLPYHYLSALARRRNGRKQLQ